MIPTAPITPMPPTILATMVEAVAPWCLLALMLAIALTFLRLMRGPTRGDRVIALDLLAVLSAGAMGVLALGQDEPTYTSVALVISLVSFLSTVALAFYVRHQGPRREP